MSTTTQSTAQATYTGILPLDRTFKVKDGAARYVLRTLDEQVAADFGCPGATHILIGRNGHIVGQAREVTGKRVRVTGFPQGGYLTVFSYGQGDDADTLKGWAI